MFLIFCSLLLITNIAIAQENVRLDVIDEKIEQLEKKKEKLVEFQTRTEQIEAKGSSIPGFEPQKRKDLTPQIDAIDRQLERLREQRDFWDPSYE